MTVHLLFAAICGGAAYDVYTGVEHWPFSPYPMFATVATERTVTAMRVAEITQEASSRELMLIDRAFDLPGDLRTRCKAPFP